MSTGNLDTIEKLPLEIAIQISKNEQFQRLLRIDESDVDKEDFEVKSWDWLIDEGYIAICPILFEDYSRRGINTFTSIILDEIDFNNRGNEINVSGRIYVGTNFDHMRLKNNKFRLLSMVKEIKKDIDNFKFSSSGNLEVIRVASIAYSDFSFGYVISFRTKEQERKEVVI